MRLTKEEYKTRKNCILKAHNWFGSDVFEEVFKDYDFFEDTDNALFYVFRKEEQTSIKLFVDYGKPFEEDIKDLNALKERLKELRVLSKTEDYAYFDVDVEIGGKRLNSDEIEKIENGL